jgi:hypothetical protein
VDELVTAVTISDIDGACLNGYLSVALTGDGGAAIGTAGPQLVNGSSMTLSIGAEPAAEDVTGIHVAITGS